MTMPLTPVVTFRGIARSEALEADILARLRKLETYYSRIMGCRVLVELSERHHESGNRFHVRIELAVPGEDIVVDHDASLHAASQDVETETGTKAGEVGAQRKHARVAVREAFEVARRRLQDHVRRQRGAVKTDVRRARGVVARVFPHDGSGFITAEDGHEVYFHEHSVLGKAFAVLEAGSAVSYVEEPGDKGPQASTVALLRPRRARREAARPRAVVS